MKKIIFTTVSFLALFTLAACNSQKTKMSDSSKTEKSSQVTKKSGKESKKEVSKAFQDLVEQTKPTMERMKDAYADVYSDIELKAAYPETIVFTYTYKNKVEVSQEQKEQTFKTLATSIKPEVDKYKEDFPNFQEQFIYLNPDKSEAANFLITQKDVEEAVATSTGEL